MLSFFQRGVLDEILNLIESVSEDFPSYSYLCFMKKGRQAKHRIPRILIRTIRNIYFFICHL